MAKFTTTVEAIEYKGKTGIKITCDCATHKTGNGAIITGPAKVLATNLKGVALKNRIHGFVVLAQHPATVMIKRNASEGIYAA